MATLTKTKQHVKQKEGYSLTFSEEELRYMADVMDSTFVDKKLHKELYWLDYNLYRTFAENTWGLPKMAKSVKRTIEMQPIVEE